MKVRILLAPLEVLVMSNLILPHHEQRQYREDVRKEIRLGLADLVERLGKFEMTCIGGSPGSIPDILFTIGLMYETPGPVVNNRLSNFAGGLRQ